ncbi:uncharacterized protein EV154DRAFT_498159 [Mucor mucedo]|uniref:uncharacterized protein n=1 Tax=Mucor mucedo TaxID=29922 RepID=UPI00221E8D61|nr:uncharacterized protein EV154DRAFT_498159 [Mucor mucedo]KAI7894548.1 hypothetical protein EV154DRAFT_498159 [Mucor mucedo]
MSSTRLEYREPKKPRAVCVYTIAQESRYLVVENLSTIGVIKEFIRHCGQFGKVEAYRLLDDHDASTEGEDVCWLAYDNVSSARYAKRMMDDKVYCYQRLRVYYVPEYETADDIRAKFADRFQAIHKRLRYTPTRHKKRDIQVVIEQIEEVPVKVELRKKTIEGKRRRI